MAGPFAKRCGGVHEFPLDSVGDDRKDAMLAHLAKAEGELRQLQKDTAKGFVAWEDWASGE